MNHVPEVSPSPSAGSSEQGAPIYVCKEGALVPYARLHSSLDRRWRELGGEPVSDLHGLLLPQCRLCDALSAQPPLALRLTLEEVAAVAAAEDYGLLAATLLGPPQEKTSNEDFALAAVIRSPDGAAYPFVAVADGVSTRTFWPERSSRLACFGALRLASQHLFDGRRLSEADAQRLRSDLTSGLQDLLQADRRLLQRRRASPVDWSTETFQRHQRRMEYWYNTTLIVALAGPSEILLLWSGDGGILVRKRLKGSSAQQSRPLESGSDPLVQNVVSLSGKIHFAAGRIVKTAELMDVVALLVSDGVDRTRQTLGSTLDLEVAEDSEMLASALDRLCRQKKAEVDNYSAAILRWPQSARLSSQARRRHANLANLIVRT